MGRRGWSGSRRQASFLLRAVILLLWLYSPSYAQNNVGIGTTAPDPSAILDLTSSDKGFLCPRLTTAQMNSVAAPATGLFIYNTTLSAFYYYNGTAWVPFLAPSNAWQLTGNTGTSAETNYLGTADGNALVIKTNAIQRMVVMSTGEVGVGATAPISKFAVGDGNVSLTNTLNTASQLNFYEPSGSGNNYTGFQAGAMASDIVYTLPTTAPTAGQVLTAGATPTTLQWSTVSSGTTDTLWFVGAGTSSLVGRGNNNTGAGNYSIAAGQNNSASGANSVAIGGLGNVASGIQSTVSGGKQNQAGATSATVSGGETNNAIAQFATVGGGNANSASGQYTTIAGGQSNIASAQYSTVAGGSSNSTTGGQWATVGGGQTNFATALYATVSGGLQNTAAGNYSTVAGGQLNTANGTHGLVGGYNNSTGSNAHYSMVFGANTSVAQANTVVFNHGGTVGSSGGLTRVGIRNVAPTEALDVTGNVRLSGALMPNNLPGTAGQLLISAGANNPPVWASGTGLFWSLTGNAGTSPSTNFFGTTDSVDVVFRTNNNEKIRLTASGSLGIGTSAPGAKIELSNGNMWLSNTNNTAGRIRLYEPSSSGTNYTEFRARAQAANLSYTLPDTAGQANDVLTTDANGNLYWTNNILTGALYLGSTTTSSISSNTNDFNLDGNYTLHRISATGNYDITGMAGGVDGRVVIIVNVGSNTITLRFEDNGSQAGNRIIGSGGNFTMQTNKAVSLVYDGVSQRWRIYAAYP
jgi:hypothetical protein